MLHRDKLDDSPQRASAAGLPSSASTGGAAPSFTRSTRAVSPTATAMVSAICEGIIERLDYVASLGVDAIWISPFFKSPMKDYGYDVSAITGRLIRSSARSTTSTGSWSRLTARGLRLIIDQVLSHTSDEHAWFQESRKSRDNDKADWYVWADPKPDGTPPNNWLSIFGGSAWQWESRRRPVLPAQFPGQPAGPQLPLPCGRRADARGSGILAGARRGRVPARCDQFLLPRSAAARQSAEAEGGAPRPRLHDRQSLRLPVSPLRQHAAPEPRFPRGAARG